MNWKYWLNCWKIKESLKKNCILWLTACVCDQKTGPKYFTRDREREFAFALQCVLLYILGVNIQSWFIEHFGILSFPSSKAAINLFITRFFAWQKIIRVWFDWIQLISVDSKTSWHYFQVYFHIGGVAKA